MYYDPAATGERIQNLRKDRNSRPGQKADGVAEMPMERCKSAAEKFPPPGCRGQIGEKQYFSNH